MECGSGRDIIIEYCFLSASLKFPWTITLSSIPILASAVSYHDTFLLPVPL